MLKSWARLAISIGIIYSEVPRYYYNKYGKETAHSSDYLFSQSDGRGIAILSLPGATVRKIVVVDFGQNINAPYMNGFDSGKYNISITAFNIDGGDIGLFMKQQEKGWNKVFDKEKEGDPAKKFQATRPFAIEQETLKNNVSQPEMVVKHAADERLLNPNNTELKTIRRQSTRSATGEKHPNTSSELSSKKTLTQPEIVVKQISTTRF